MPDDTPADKLPLIGRDQFVIEKLAKRLLDASHQKHEVGALHPTDDRRGFYFEVRTLTTSHPWEPTGHIARVTVELDRLGDE